MNFKIDPHITDTIYSQLASFIELEIRNGNLAVGNRLLSVSQACENYGVSRDTVLMAYKMLQERNIVTSLPGKGFYVTRSGDIDKIRLFAIFDAMNQYKETLYRSFVDALGENYDVTIAFHYYNETLFDTLVENALGKYDYYVMVPHFTGDVTPTLDKIDERRLLLLDAFPNNYSRNCAAVYQDFYNDSYNGLKCLLGSLRKYKALHIVYNDKFQYMPSGYVEGAYRFAGEFRLPVYIEPGFDMNNIEEGHCYMAISERDLASFIKVVMTRKLQVGRDIGLLSLDDTPLKEVLIGGITTLTTDFEMMGRTAAQFIKNGERRRTPNPWKLYDRGSL
ncbi:MAG: GntR family transcriptional regulator [Alistipes sp.]|nr:GntR family transcriptional regulator [Alistipes sp.]